MEDLETLAKDNILSIIPHSFDERLAMRNESWFKNNYSAWHKSDIRKEYRIGSIMELISQIPMDSKYSDWVKHYVSNQLSYEQIINEMKECMKVFNLNWKQAVCFWWIHVLDYSWQGRQYEVKAFEIAKREFPDYFIRFASPLEDKHFGVDIIVEDEYGEIATGIQVKGFKYFLGQYAEQRMIGHTSGYTAFRKQTGARVHYLISESLEEKPQPFKLYPSYNFGDEFSPDYSEIPRLYSNNNWNVSVVKIDPNKYSNLN